MAYQILKASISCLAVLYFVMGYAHANESFTWVQFNVKTEKKVCKTLVNVGDEVEGKVKAIVTTEDGEPGQKCLYAGRIELVLDSNYATLSTHSVWTNGQTDYTLERKDKKLIIKGKRKNKALNSILELNDTPFFADEILGLIGFLKSGKESLKFQVVIMDKLEIYEMKVENEGSDTLELANGKEVEAYEVVWGLTGIMRMFYEQTYWFRVSDNMFLEQQDPENDIKKQILLK